MKTEDKYKRKSFWKKKKDNEAPSPSRRGKGSKKKYKPKLNIPSKKN